MNILEFHNGLSDLLTQANASKLPLGKIVAALEMSKTQLIIAQYADTQRRMGEEMARDITEKLNAEKPLIQPAK